MSVRVIVTMMLAGLLLGLPAFSVAQDTNESVVVHVVQRGETMYRIAQNYNVTVEAIASFNSIADPTNIQVGQRLLIPTNGETRSEVPATHVVQAGETLKSIATLYGLTVDELANRNSITNIDRIFVGQVLNIRASSPATPSPIPTVESTVTGETSGDAPSLIYTVQGGDTLFRIATRYGLTVNDLVRANNVTDPTVIYLGQQLIIPGVKPLQSALDLPPNVSNIVVTPTMFVEGQTGEIRLTTAVPMTVNGTFLARNLSVASDQSRTLDIILVGIPVFTDAGVYPLALSLTDGAGQVTPLDLNIQVLAGGYGRESITLSSNLADLVDPNLEASELQKMQAITSNFTPSRYFDGPLSLPAAASISSPFGRKRSYDGGPYDHFHAGTDFAAAPGSSVMAAAPGYVVFADKLNVRGNVTIIDHGWGIYTVYCHQATQYVKVGDFVNTGTVIGTVGATGRVTGPHLHWEVWVNGVQVDPMQWVQQSFS
ncbi:MAG: LysM peptidoglycan-binding domain-containing protein [Anaerolineaceae bacterium]|nr:LysM peptidoglycan-binding domain-containing protein [Anaerolineaceae bacterium]